MGLILDDYRSSTKPAPAPTPDNPRLLAAADVSRTARSRSRFITPADTEPLPARFVPAEGETPQVLPFKEFVRRYYPTATAGATVPKGTTKAIMQAYRKHVEDVRTQIESRRSQSNTHGLERERLDLERARLRFQQQIKQVGPEKLHTLEAAAVQRLQELPPEKWQEDPIVGLWARLKGAGGAAAVNGQNPVPSKASTIARLTELAVQELQDLGRPGPYADALSLATNPIEALKLMRGAPKTVQQLKDQAAAEATADMDAKERFKFLTGREHSTIGAQGVSEQVFGIAGLGGITERLDKMDQEGVPAFLDALERYDQLKLFAEPDAVAGVEQLLRQRQPSVQQILEAGPPFKAQGKTIGTGQLSEDEVNALLKFVVPPDQQAQLLQP
jgi:hypothetical protein